MSAAASALRTTHPRRRPPWVPGSSRSWGTVSASASSRTSGAAMTDLSAFTYVPPSGRSRLQLRCGSAPVTPSRRKGSANGRRAANEDDPRGATRARESRAPRGRIRPPPRPPPHCRPRPPQAAGAGGSRRYHLALRGTRAPRRFPGALPRLLRPGAGSWRRPPPAGTSAQPPCGPRRSRGPLHLENPGRFEGRPVEEPGRPAGWQVELVKDVLHVALDRELGDRERLRDLPVARTSGDERQNLTLTCGQSDRALAGPAALFEPVHRVDHERGEAPRERRLPADDAAQRTDEPRRRDLLREEALAARGDCGEHGIARRLEAPDDHARLVERREARNGRDTARGRKVEIDERDVRLLLLERLRERRKRGRLEDLEVALAPEQMPDAGPEDRSSVGDDDARSPHRAGRSRSAVPAAAASFNAAPLPYPCFRRQSRWCFP